MPFLSGTSSLEPAVIPRVRLQVSDCSSFRITCTSDVPSEGEGRTAEQFFLHPHNNRTYRDIPSCNIQHKNAPEDGLLKSETC